MQAGILPALAMLADLAPDLLQWAIDDAKPRLAVDPRLRILWLNGPAKLLLAEDIDLFQKDGFLRFKNAALEAQLIRAMTRKARSDGTLCLPAGRGGHLLLQLSAPDIASLPAFFGLKISRCDLGHRIELADLKMAFGLTSTEEQVVGLLHDGLVADEIADRSKSSVGTIRSHIRSAYQKINVTSREALFYKLRPYHLNL